MKRLLALILLIVAVSLAACETTEKNGTDGREPSSPPPARPGY